MKAAAIVPAAGSGSRFGSQRSKIWTSLAQRSVIEWAVAALDHHPGVSDIIIVAAPRDADQMQTALSGYGKVNEVVPGDQTRAGSVQRGLAALSKDTEVVIVHDAARPCVSQDTIGRVLAAVSPGVAAAPGVPIGDSVKRATTDGFLLESLDRNGLWTVQTPQGSMRTDLERAYSEVDLTMLEPTDEACLLAAAGVAVRIVQGDPDNLKITYPEDIARAERILRGRYPRSPSVTRTGIGYDVHRFAAGRELWLGGVRIPHTTGLLGHSDADVVMHAVCDALLGAAGAGDIGVLFPDHDPVNKGRRSREFVAAAARRVSDLGNTVVHIDVTIVAEEPKITPYRPAMLAALAEALGCETGCISIKATTNEGMGFVGRGEGIACMAVATITGKALEED